MAQAQTKTDAIRSRLSGSNDSSNSVATKPEPPKTIGQFLEVYKGEIAKALPSHMNADRMARIAMTEFRKVPALLKCDPKTLFGAIIQCAQLGLEPGGALGHAYLIPFENRRKGITECQFIIGYRGMIDLARRSGQIVSLSARVVRSNDEFSYRYGIDETIHHVPADNDRGDITHVYAVAKLKDEGVQFDVMSCGDVNAVRDGSKGYQNAVKYKGDNPWLSSYEEMAKKTVIRRLFKYLPISIELQKAISLDERGDANQSQDNGFVIDVDPIDVSLSSSDVYVDPVVLMDKLNDAVSLDQLDEASSLISSIESAEARDSLIECYERRRKDFE